MPNENNAKFGVGVVGAYQHLFGPLPLDLACPFGNFGQLADIPIWAIRPSKRERFSADEEDTNGGRITNTTDPYIDSELMREWGVLGKTLITKLKY